MDLRRTILGLAFVASLGLSNNLQAESTLSHGDWVGGSIAGTLIGFGVGQAIQGRYMDTGWIVTAGMGGGLTLFLLGPLVAGGEYWWGSDFEWADQSLAGGIISIVGLATMAGFWGYSVFDLWTAPHEISSASLLNHSGIDRLTMLQKENSSAVIFGLTIPF